MFKSLLLKGRTLCLLLCCLVSSLVVTAQTKHTGKVIGSDDKLPVVGASVRIKGTNTGAVTDVNGDFTLTLSPGNVIVVSYIGYQTTEITVKGSEFLTISLQPASSSLNEVVVTGYTAQKKKDITGSVAVVDVTSMKAIVSGNTTALLQGQASGVTVTNSGSPGAGTSINIRGIGSTGSTAPLVIIDGVAGDLDNLNPNDVESIQVLKDAGASAIYGIRAANGVIVVTTKKGKQGEATITYDGSYGTTQPLADGFKLAGTQTYMQAEYLSNLHDGNTGAGHPSTQFDPNATGTWSIPDYITPAGAHTGDPNTAPSAYNMNTTNGIGSNPITLANKVGTDWFKTVFRAAPIQQHSITASGGSEKSTYLMSVNYLNEQGTLLSTYDKRYGIRANTAFVVADHVRVGENAYFYYKQNPQIGNQNEGNIISFIYREPPIIPVYDIMGNFAGTRSPGLSNSQNPYADAYRNLANVNNDWNISGNVYAEVDFLKHFTLHTSFGGSVDNYYNSNFSPTYYENAEGNTNVNGYSENSGFTNQYTWQNTLTYNQVFGKHSIKILAGSEAVTNTDRGFGASRGNYVVSTDPAYVNLNTGDPSTKANSDYAGGYTIESFFARLEYSFNDKYLLNANIRRDGYSGFAQGHQWGLFPSASAAWRISKEDFLKGVSWLSDLKLRAGYGVIGSLSDVILHPNNAFNLFATDPGSSYYDINGTSTSTVLGIYNSQLGNTKTTWQNDKEADFGFDASLLNNSIDFSFDYFKKTIAGLIFQPVPLAYTAPPTQPFKNAGNIENTGFEFNIGYHGNISDFKYKVDLNVSHYTNKVASLPSAYYDEYSSGSSRLQNFTRLQAGQPVGEFFGLQEIGLYQNAADVANNPGYAGAVPGLIKYKDVNGDGKIDLNDRTFIGNPNPKLTGGFNLNVSYKNFDLNTNLYFVYGNKVANYTKYWTDFPQVFDGNVSANVITDSWQPGADNSHATIPILTRAANLGNVGAFTSYYLEDGSFLKMKTLQIGYNIPAAELKRIGISRFRIYLMGNNLFTLTKYTGMDPELQNSDLGNNTSFGIDFGNYPSNQKRYTVGAQVTF
ncbi:MAG: SusC/RagA family TonB-linked outer membrane protein [Sphingobacteriales bacterium]